MTGVPVAAVAIVYALDFYPFKMKNYPNSLTGNLSKDIPSGLVVFLVALPLCLGIALASGAPLFSGLITGIVGGVVVAWLSGSNLAVSGPAAGLTVDVINGRRHWVHFRLSCWQ